MHPNIATPNQKYRNTPPRYLQQNLEMWSNDWLRASQPCHTRFRPPGHHLCRSTPAPYIYRSIWHARHPCISFSVAVAVAGQIGPGPLRDRWV